MIVIGLGVNVIREVRAVAARCRSHINSENKPLLSIDQEITDLRHGNVLIICVKKVHGHRA